MESLMVLRGVCEVSELAKPSAPETASQRAFDAARARSPRHAELPTARRITKDLGRSWREVLETAHAPEGTHSRRLGHAAELCHDWLTEEFVVFALRLVALRLGKPTVTMGEYRVERAAMLRADHKRWLHGRDLFLPSDGQVRHLAGGKWSAALSLAGLAPTPRASRNAKVGRFVLTRVEVIERFYDHYEEKPSLEALEAFARGNGLPMSREAGRKYADTVAEWEERRRSAGLPPPRVVNRLFGRRREGAWPDYSRDVGAARPGEKRWWGRWADPDECVAWIRRYIATLGPRDHATQEGYDDWTRRQTDAPRSSCFRRHGGWAALRRQAQESSEGALPAPDDRLGSA
jgi:hypothetical protein